MSVIVVGAGLAGLTAAVELLARGIDVTVLEARARVGGRTYGVQVAPGQWADGGGAYLGDRHTQLTSMIRQHGLATTATTMTGSIGCTRRSPRFAPMPPGSPRTPSDSTV